MVELAQAYLKKQKGSSITARMKTEELTPLMMYEEAIKKDETALAIFEEYCDLRRDRHRQSHEHL